MGRSYSEPRRRAWDADPPTVVLGVISSSVFYKLVQSEIDGCGLWVRLRPCRGYIPHSRQRRGCHHNKNMVPAFAEALWTGMAAIGTTLAFNRAYKKNSWRKPSIVSVMGYYLIPQSLVFIFILMVLHTIYDNTTLAIPIKTYLICIAMFFATYLYVTNNLAFFRFEGLLGTFRGMRCPSS